MADVSSLLGAAGIGGAIGKAIVSLELETTKYQAELKAMNAETVASTNSSSSAFSKFGSISSTALLGVGAAAVAGAAFSIKAAVEANEAHLKLQNTFENNANLADSSVEAFERQADALRQLTGVDDEAIISGQALLGTMGTTGTQVQELTPLIVDLASKYDIDLQAAFKAVGRATQGSTGALARYVGEIEAGTTPAENFTNVIDKLGSVQGFAAQRAEAEPWRVLSSQLEELAEIVGQSLLPPLIEASKILVEMVSALEPVLDLVGKLGPAVHILGEAFQFMTSPAIKVVNVLAQGIQPTQEMVDLIGGQLPPAFGEAAASAEGATKSINKFAHMTGDELTKWSDDTKESFQSYVINLNKVQEETDFTRKDLRESFQAMLEHARDLNQAMKTLSREHWINDDFVKFLAEQPDKLILFADSNEKQQQKMQAQWEKSGEILKNQVNDRLDVMTGILDKLDTGETKHKVTIQYDYVGFDPSKPGMAPRPATG